MLHVDLHVCIYIHQYSIIPLGLFPTDTDMTQVAKFESDIARKSSFFALAMKCRQCSFRSCTNSPPTCMYTGVEEWLERVKTPGVDTELVRNFEVGFLHRRINLYFFSFVVPPSYSASCSGYLSLFSS